MSDKRTNRHERDGRSSDEHLMDQDKQRERQTETTDAMNASVASRPERKDPSERGLRDEVDQASDESFPASDPAQQP